MIQKQDKLRKEFKKLIHELDSQDWEKEMVWDFIQQALQDERERVVEEK